MRKRKLILSIVILASAAAALFVAPNWAKFEWRVKLAQLKAGGELPGISWGSIFKIMTPTDMGLRDVRVFVTGKREDPARACPVLWETMKGSYWGRASDWAVLGHLTAEKYLDIYERGPVKVKPGDVVLDVGSHLGTFTRFALDRGASKVVGIDPDQTNNICFKQTFAEEIETGRVSLVEAAAAAQSGTLRFAPNPGYSGTGSVVREEQGGGPVVEVPAVTIDEAVAELGLQRVDFVKMDIEGSERFALRGARQTMSRFHPRMAICIYHLDDDPEVLPKIVLSADDSYRYLTRGDFQAYFY